ncbi:MAG: glycoside hydrolase family 31 protein [Puniceicoccaceae bacterium]
MTANYTDCFEIPLEPDEKLWSGAVKEGLGMPFEPGYKFDFYANNLQNQLQPLVLSDKGLYVWSEEPFAIERKESALQVRSFKDSVRHGRAGETLRDAHAFACKEFFPPVGKVPNPESFSQINYSTWIEMTYFSTQEKVLDYARGILDAGLPPGVLVIDESWEENYGIWDFHSGRFPDPKVMVDELHEMGFKVLLFVVPFISPDRHMLLEELLERQALFLDGGGGDVTYQNAVKPALIEWWSGYSACLDFTSVTARQWFREQLDYLTGTYGVDGFKFEGADMNYYNGTGLSSRKVSPNEHCRLYAQLATNYPLNQVRACWKLGGQALLQRLHDKEHSWQDLRMNIPHILVQSLSGYPFACSDMIGGGLWIDFLPGCDFDQELFVRSAQCQALFPVMQISLAPWRVLEPAYLEAFMASIKTRQNYEDKLNSLAADSSTSGRPIIASLEYVFPGQGYASVTDQFMLGSSILVAPMLRRGTKRIVVLPEGNWIDDAGASHKGGQSIEVEVPLERLPVFTRAN